MLSDPLCQTCTSVQVPDALLGSSLLLLLSVWPVRAVAPGEGVVSSLLYRGAGYPQHLSAFLPFPSNARGSFPINCGGTEASSPAGTAASFVAHAGWL